MKKRFLTICLVAVAGGVVMYLGCSGGGVSGDVSTPEGHTRITIEGSALSGSAVMDDLGELLAISDPFKDAADGTGGVGSGGPESIYDSAASTCLFSGEAASVGGYFEIQWGTAASPVDGTDCTDENNCIYCNVNNAAQADCTISCDGLVASNSTSAGDTFKIYLTAYHAFTTEMPDANGMVRLDGDASSLTAEANLSANIDDSVGDDSRVYAKCENGVTDATADKVTTDTVVGSGMALDTHEAGVWAEGYDITALDDLVGEVGESTCGVGGDTACEAGGCHIEDKLTIIAAMTGADTPGASIDMAFTEISVSATICDSEDVCAIYTP